MTMTAASGPSIVKERKDRKWSRAELARRAGLQYHQVVSVERELRKPKPEELAAIARALGDGPVQTGHESTSAAPTRKRRRGMQKSRTDADDRLDELAIHRTTEWSGLTEGDQCRVTREHGIFHFLCHHSDDHQAYVQVYGPIGGHARSKLRSFRSDRLRNAKGRKLA